ncbi:NAD+ synthase [Marinicella litoralis]|uniref:Glutamine-dependent NAD(+) synthetase n=1 Tax=Marinicella litoralis TaxID=644220 RepID=A0A4R6XHZ5_9GAMM|nr:NAD+ synthase [Marinicella litoralis]TDR17500.1 NAD+ synthase (glutamine-hydrolysing) [Marinicella litoralis]
MKKPNINIAMAQLNVKVGDLAGNQQLILDAIQEARNEHIDILVFTELVVCGYPPEDLLFHQQFLDDCLDSVKFIADHTDNITVILGFPRNHPNEPELLHNSAALIQDGEIKMVYDKHKLPNYLVFDEKRYFSAGKHDGIAEITIQNQLLKIGVTICEDIWYEAEPVVYQASENVDLLINISASPYATDKINSRIAMLQRRAKRFATPLVYCNLVGGQDELIFDGTSCAIDAEGELMALAPSFEAAFTQVNFAKDQKFITVTEPPLAELYDALVSCTRDYFQKNGFSQAVLGLSGGIDSALTAVIAADAIGAENVTGILMPSKFSSDHSIADAQVLADTLGMNSQLVPIKTMHDSFHGFLAPVFNELYGDYFQGQTDENIQARIRGVLLMAFSNNNNAILLCTSNKSETAVGYTTLYGDMAGGFAPIKDLFKLQVYALSEYRNSIDPAGPVIPVNTITKPPSAELRPDQKDSDSLPEYEILDAILKAYLHHHKDAAQIAKSLDQELALVIKVLKMVDRNEYKRQQAAPGPRVTQMAFGKDRRMPITNGFVH